MNGGENKADKIITERRKEKGGRKSLRSIRGKRAEREPKKGAKKRVRRELKRKEEVREGGERERKQRGGSR